MGRYVRLAVLELPSTGWADLGNIRGSADMTHAKPENSGPKQGAGRWRRGQSGNPAGKPKGARHAALLALDAVGAGAAGDVMQAVVDAAKGGDMRAADILLRRLWPERKGRPMAMDLPSIGGVCRATIKVRIRDNQDEKVVAMLVT